jgi:hypothetical protein
MGEISHIVHAITALTIELYRRQSKMSVSSKKIYLQRDFAAGVY